MSNINLMNCDCMEYMKTVPDKFYELAIVDPPYGIGADKKFIKQDTIKQKNGKSLFVKRNDFVVKEWDIIPCPEYFQELQRISRNQIIWGGNYFGLQASSCWIVWDKCNVGTMQSDCELAWTSFKTAVRKYEFMWSGMCQGSPSDGKTMQGNKTLNEKRIHPTQKPVALYKWLLHNYAKPNDRIFDSHLGSMSIAIACHDYGFDLTGCEIDKEYFDDGMQRLKDHQRQLTLDLGV